MTIYWLVVESQVAYGWQNLLIADFYNFFFIPYLTANPAPFPVEEKLIC
jgi:hypothetical protein